MKNLETMNAATDGRRTEFTVMADKIDILTEKVNRAEMNAAQAKPAMPTIQVNIDATKAIEAVNNAIAALEKAIAEFGSNMEIR